MIDIAKKIDTALEIVKLSVIFKLCRFLYFTNNQVYRSPFSINERHNGFFFFFFSKMKTFLENPHLKSYHFPMFDHQLQTVNKK